jgi:hypothetical protein
MRVLATSDAAVHTIVKLSSFPCSHPVAQIFVASVALDVSNTFMKLLVT